MEIKAIGRCSQGCELCHYPYCERVKKHCAVCGAEFVVGELFKVDGKEVCLRCKTEMEEEAERTEREVTDEQWEYMAKLQRKLFGEFRG